MSSQRRLSLIKEHLEPIMAQARDPNGQQDPLNVLIVSFRERHSAGRALT